MTLLNKLHNIGDVFVKMSYTHLADGYWVFVEDDDKEVTLLEVFSFVFNLSYNSFALGYCVWVFDHEILVPLLYTFSLSLYNEMILLYNEMILSFSEMISLALYWMFAIFVEFPTGVIALIV